MGLVLRFPIERARTASAEMFAEEPAKILILPAVRIERKGELELVLPEFDHQSPGEPNSAGGRGRRRTPRN